MLMFVFSTMAALKLIFYLCDKGCLEK